MYHVSRKCETYRLLITIGDSLRSLCDVDFLAFPSQFAYGEDGMDGTFIEKTKFDLMTFSHAEFRMMYHIDLNAYAARGENWMSPAGALSNRSGFRVFNVFSGTWCFSYCCLVYFLTVRPSSDH